MKNSKENVEKDQDIAWIYNNNLDNTARFALGVKGNRMLACIGLNPSTASPDHLDNTLKSVVRISKVNGYDGWLMVNLYPFRVTDPLNLPAKADPLLIQHNIQTIHRLIEEHNIKDIWLAFGNLIEHRKYLADSFHKLLLELSQYKINWKCANKVTRKGHPRHPLYLPSNSYLHKFDTATYLKRRSLHYS